MFWKIPSGNIPEKVSFSWNLSKLLVVGANCLAMHCLKRISSFIDSQLQLRRLVSKHLSQTNHLGLDNLAPNSTCLTKISQKPKEKPFFFFHSLDGKHDLCLCRWRLRFLRKKTAVENDLIASLFFSENTRFPRKSDALFPVFIS